MKIVVIGGSGLIGSSLVNKLRQLDHTVISASPDSGINTITSEGLNGAIKDTDVVVGIHVNWWRMSMHDILEPN